MRIAPGVPLLVLALAGASACTAPAGVAEAQGRLRPPNFVTCDRNHLTAFWGRVVALERGNDSTTLRMETDENTKERFILRHAGADASAWFFIGGKPFTAADWTNLLPEGRLRKGARATVWVCTDEPSPKVDWEPPAPSES
jgi:hypothetical protein